MKQAIKVLEADIKKCNEAIATAELAMDEPEMVCDIEFAMNDISNLHVRIIEMQAAIKILNEQVE